MGLNEFAKEALEIVLPLIDRKTWEGVSMLEYGNQIVRGEDPRLTAKQYFTGMGVRHVSIDINAMDGALGRDLSRPLANVGEPFDVVTNFGTTEHVIDNQYWPFKNIHNMVRPGGVMISIVPTWGFKPTHGEYRYDPSFFGRLSEKNGYDIIELDGVGSKEDRRRLIKYIGVKSKNEPFINEIEFKLIEGVYYLDKNRYANWLKFEEDYNK